MKYCRYKQINSASLLYKGFTLMEMLISMTVIAILMAASVPMLTQFSTAKTGVDRNVIKCITNNNSTGWYDTDGAGATILPTTEPCRAAVSDTQYNRGKAYNTAAWFAGIHGTADQQSMAKKILRVACDQGGEKACDYFINHCWKDGIASAPYCDDTANFEDITYYLHQNSSTNTNYGATYIANQLETLLPKMISNLKNEVFYACNNTQTPDANQNLGINLACDLAKPWVYIKACNDGNTDACIFTYDPDSVNHLITPYNRSCVQIKTAWFDAPTGVYNLTYDSSGNYDTVNCNMTSMASAAITGCNGITSNIFNNNPPYDDCTYAYNQGYNQTCSVIYSNWTTAPTGTYNLTTNGAPSAALISSSCTYNPPNHAACMATGAGTLCGDGTYYIGDLEGRHLFTTANNEPGTYTWNNGLQPVATGTINAINGQSNYNTLIALSNGESPYAAANACKSLNTAARHGKTDWYLPAINELVLLAANRTAIGNFPDVSYGGYWSATEQVALYAKSLYDSTSYGSTYNRSKFDATYVRCIRDDTSINTSCPNVGNTCSDGSKYAGFYDSRYLFTTTINEPGTYSWNNGSIPGCNYVAATDLNNGKINFDKLLAATDSGAPYKAAIACRDLNLDSSRNLTYTDWYLPAKNEVALYHAISSLPNNPYTAWASSENSIQNAYVSSYHDYLGKWNSYNVRCVRSE